MHRVVGWMLVAVLCCAAGARAGEETPDARLREAQATMDEATKLKASGGYSEALARAEHALALREAVLGGLIQTSPAVWNWWVSFISCEGSLPRPSHCFSARSP